MNDGENTAAARRVPLALYDTAGDEYTGAAPSGTEVKISIAGSAWATANGTVTKLRDGDYYYEATAAESRGRGFRMLRLAATGLETTVVDWYVGVRRKNDPSAEARRIPIYLTDSNGDAVTGLTLSGAEIEMSLAGSAYATGTGTAGEIGLGAYYYEPTVAEYNVRGSCVLNVNDASADEYKYEYELGQENSPAPTGTTAEDIRARMAAVITSLTPASLSGNPFRESRYESGDEFTADCEGQPAGAFRRFHVIESGGEEPPETSSGIEHEVENTFTVTVAYPKDGRAGSGQTTRRYEVMREDQRIIETAVGMLGKANFTSPYPDATWVGGGSDRSSGESCDYMVLTFRMIYVVIL